MNKFLTKYPQLRTPKVGDKIRVIKLMNFKREIVYTLYDYEIGDTGTITFVNHVHLGTVINVQFTKGTHASLYLDEVEYI